MDSGGNVCGDDAGDAATDRGGYIGCRLLPKTARDWLGNPCSIMRKWSSPNPPRRRSWRLASCSFLVVGLVVASRQMAR